MSNSDAVKADVHYLSFWDKELQDLRHRLAIAERERDARRIASIKESIATLEKSCGVVRDRFGNRIDGQTPPPLPRGTLIPAPDINAHERRKRKEFEEMRQRDAEARKRFFEEERERKNNTPLARSGRAAFNTGRILLGLVVLFVETLVQVVQDFYRGVEMLRGKPSYKAPAKKRR